MMKDPVVPDWGRLELPDTWADQFNLRRPLHLLRFFRGICSRKRRQVELPADVPGRDGIPKYILQEFHSLPNGNYSKRITRGYITGFDRSMLGVMTAGRERLARSLAGCRSVLDVGCAGGRTAAALKQAGVDEVWGLDPSPYLLQHAAKDYPGLQFVQGLAEDTGFASERFDGLAVCFLLHEMPPRYLERAMAEFRRILKPGGLLAICEPSPEQIRKGYKQLFREYGLKGMYFHWMANFVFEPFLLAWHRISSVDYFASRGFDVVSDEKGMPLRHILLRKQA